VLRRNSDTFFRPREDDSGLRCWWKRIRLALRRYRLQATGYSVQVRGWLLAINGGARKPQRPHLRTIKRPQTKAKKGSTRTETLHTSTKEYLVFTSFRSVRSVPSRRLAMCLPSIL